MANISIDALLQQYELLDDEGYLLPPQDDHVQALREKLFDLLEMKEMGHDLGWKKSNLLRHLTFIFDYYHDVIDEYLEENNLSVNSTDDSYEWNPESSEDFDSEASETEEEYF